MDPLLKIENLSCNYGKFTALKNVSLDIPRGCIFGLLGPNGAGKTTLLRIITRILEPTSGNIIFDGRPLSLSDNSRMGYLPEERGLYRDMPVGEQAVFFARLKGMSRTDAKEKLKNLFSRFGLADCWDRDVSRLSKGMAQKVQFIITVVHNPELIILDEPFSGLDPVNARVLRDELLRLKQEGATIILSTHDMNAAETLCDRAAFIDKAEIVSCGSIDEIREKFREEDGSVPHLEDIFIKTAGEGRV